ncbi:PH domain-containing protein [Clostridium cellulovorans]|uniref:SHOCT domain-containing protein n=1 Tax=Clostridium cellulovorans (strain ATCC 35296 / DSM 3052 / OCM 3 / 743B) TaxID=573061 RepID=D9STE0_CLOC7|nr:PH domain-containing protein [Clostridium cellulovorans]ADL50756.1 hypothetical protein Clocel_0991 [Clostridium cellulovorans 743B]
MKEYVGYGGNKVTIDGQNVYIKQAFQKEECIFGDIKSVSFREPTILKNGAVVITTLKAKYEIMFLKKNLQEFKELYDMLYAKVYLKDDSSENNEYISNEDTNSNHTNQEFSVDETKKISRNANDMFQYCVDNKYGTGMTKSSSIKNFELIENSLNPDEEVLLCFCGLNNFVSMTKHDGHFAYVVTDKRFIMAQKKMIGQVVQAIPLKNISDCFLSAGAVMATIEIHTSKKTFKIEIGRSVATIINNKINEAISGGQVSSNATTYQGSPGTINDSATEILKLKELLDMGAITEEEFAAKKKIILGI